MVMGLLPPLEGLYRDDLISPDLWKQFKHHPVYRRLDKLDGVLLSHAHLDHSGYISFLRQDIPVYATSVTSFLTKAIQDSGKSDFDQQVCYFTPTEREYPSGWKQIANLTGKTKNQRQFCTGDIRPEDLSPEALEFWKWGFWEKTKGQKPLESLTLKGYGDYPFNLHCFPVDHSIPGACAWGIETDSGWIIYSGDLRLHGKRYESTREFIEQAAQLKPRALILEGTNVKRQSNVSEREVYENGLKAITGAKGPVIADFSPRDMDRLLTFRQIAMETGRKLAILPRDAYLLKTLRLLEPGVPDISKDDNIVIYQDTIASKSPAIWMRNLCQEYDEKIILAEDVKATQDSFILCFSFFDLNELPSIRPVAGSLYVYSSSEPHDEEQEIDFRRLHNWLEHFGLRGVGLPVETNGIWVIPDAEKGLHASGHACGPDLLEIVRRIMPQVLMPVHSESPEYYAEHLQSGNIDVILPVPGGTIEV
jgi:ribonuclease J